MSAAPRESILVVKEFLCPGKRDNSPELIGSSGCSFWTSYTSFESSWPADFDYLSVLDQFNDVAS